jgi:hypothetical protein
MIFFAHGGNFTPVVIEDIASETECRKLEDFIHKHPLAPIIKSMCVPVRKSTSKVK